MKPREDEPTSILQTFTGCTLVYDLTAHKIVVTAQDGSELLMLQPLPDNPGGFSLYNDGQSIAVHNPGGVDFIGVHDSFEDNKAIFG